MRAREPDREGLATSSGGVRIGWADYGAGARAILCVPPWQIVDSRVWKMQVAYLSRHFRVLTFDPPGRGRSDHAGYSPEAMADHMLAVLDAAGVDRASLLCLSRAAWPGLIVAGTRPDRVDRLVLTAAALAEQARPGPAFFEARERYEGWQKFNAHHWRANYRDFVEFFMGKMFSEPHSTKAWDDGVRWALETTPETLIAAEEQAGCRTPLADLLARVRVPTLVMHRRHDRDVKLEEGRYVAERIPGARFAEFDGEDHLPFASDVDPILRCVEEFLGGLPS